MKRHLWLFFQTMVLSSGLFAQTNGEVSANIKGIGNDTIFIFYTGLNSNVTYRDTLLAHKNHFKYSLPINEPADITIIPKKAFHRFESGRLYIPSTQFIHLIIRPTDRISIAGNLSQKYFSYQTSGSDLDRPLDSLRRVYKSLDLAAVNYELQLGSLPKNNVDKSKPLFDKRVATSQQISKVKLDFIAQNLDNEASAFLLLRQSFEVFTKYYQRLSRNVKNGIFHQALENKLLQYKKFTETNAASEAIKERSIAPDFCLPDLKGEAFYLSKVHRKYIVIDFWGSWCGWCIKEFPKMKEYYHKYKSQVEFIGIACNDKKEDWQKAVGKYQLSWTQVLNSSTEDVAVLYGIKAFPTKIILDQDLRILKIFKGAGDTFFQELDKLME